MRIKALELSNTDLRKLALLKENQEIYEIQYRHYDPVKILREIGLIDSKINDLLVRKKELVDKRLVPSEIRLGDINIKLQNNKRAQLAIIKKRGLVAKLNKAIEEVKTMQSKLEVENGILETN